MTTPEEELYVLVANYKNSHWLFIAGRMGSLLEVQGMQKSYQEESGDSVKTRIARLQFVGDDGGGDGDV